MNYLTFVTACLLSQTYFTETEGFNVVKYSTKHRSSDEQALHVEDDSLLVCVLPEAINVTIHPESPARLTEQQTLLIIAHLTPPLDLSCHPEAVITDKRVAKIINVNYTFSHFNTTTNNDSYIDRTSDTSAEKFNEINVHVKANQLGMTSVQLLISNSTNENQLSENGFLLETYDIIVIREKRVIDAVFLQGTLVFILLINFAFGCEIDHTIIWGYVRRPVAPAIGAACQFCLMPLIGLAVSHALHLNPVYGFGLLIQSCSPGGVASNMWTLLLNGDLNLSITMTFISLILALGMMPLWMLVVTLVYSSSNIEVPYMIILITLAQLAGPCLIGILIHKVSPKAARFVSKLLKPFAVVILLWIFAFGTYVNLYMWLMMGSVPVIIPSGMLLPWGGFLLGFGLAKLLGQDNKRAITISIETGIQNVGIPIIILMQHFQQPDGDMAATVVNAVGLFTPMPLFVIFFITTIYRKFKDAEDKDDTDRVLMVDEDNDEMSSDPSDSDVSHSANLIPVM